MSWISKTIDELWLNSKFADPIRAQRYKEAKWNEENLRLHAGCIKDIFHGYKHIVEVNYSKVFENYREMNGTRVYESFQVQFKYPHRELGDHTHLMLMRGRYTHDDDIFARDEFGIDALFAGTNNDYDAMMLALKYK